MKNLNLTNICMMKKDEILGKYNTLLQTPLAEKGYETQYTTYIPLEKIRQIYEDAKDLISYYENSKIRYKESKLWQIKAVKTLAANILVENIPNEIDEKRNRLERWQVDKAHGYFMDHLTRALKENYPKSDFENLNLEIIFDMFCLLDEHERGFLVRKRVWADAVDKRRYIERQKDIDLFSERQLDISNSIE